MYMSEFFIYPAIDLRGGRVVRLKQGDPARVTIYGDDPGSTAQRWLKIGAKWLHVINLDGALEESDSANLLALNAILDVARQYIPKGHIQYGGGVRTIADMERVISLGVDRVILGTVAISSPEIVEQAVKTFGSEKIAVAIDVYDGRVKVRGWQEQTDQDPVSVGGNLVELGITTLIYTNIARDGVGSGVDISMTRRLAEHTGLRVIASGGVNSLDDVNKVKDAGLDGLIIGRALYDGKVSLEEALKC
jgi:phosphoribosylformimino-5-aminoimidazole carboxamide ribotide isomerase